MSSSCLYVFALAEPGFDHNVLELAELGRTATGRIAALHRTIDPGELAGMEHEEVTEDSRLAHVARRHDRIVQALHGVATVLPVRMGTLFADADQLRAVLTAHEDDLVAALEEVRDCDEWRVRLAGRATPEQRPAARPRSGTDYLRARREARDEAVRSRESGDAAWAETVHALGSLAQRRAVAGARGTQAYLVPRARRGTFAAAAEDRLRAMAGCGYAADVRGPLPPYAFVTSTLGGAS